MTTPDPNPDSTPDSNIVLHIPLSQINATALTRDREGLDAEPFQELRLSIAANGLRQPVEVFALDEPVRKDGHRRDFGLISGLRRLMAFEALHELTGHQRYATIPAFLRASASMSERLAAMVEENEIRESISPWERGRIAWLAQRQDLFPSVEEAVAKLYPMASRQKRYRLCAVAHLVEELDGWLTNPENLSLRQALRISAAFQAGFGEVIRTALSESSREDPASEWRLLLPILTEAEALPANAAKPRPGRPRRVYRPRRGITIRREQTHDGYALHFTGRLVDSEYMDLVVDEIERKFGPE